MVKAAQVKELREKSGAGMMDCKKALKESDGDMDKAMEYLKEKGLASAKKKADRTTTEGRVESYIHLGGKIGVLIEVNCETDFVASNDEFKQFTKDIAMQVAASAPQYISRDEVPQEEVEKERERLKQQAIDEGKPEHVVDQIVDGKMDKYYEEICLLDQPFVKDPDKSVDELKKEKIAKIGENISVRRFVRYELGEGKEKKEENFAEEVEAIKQNT
ncbi:translation elongation factor Ts [Natranaerobius thermophilus]|uniref:Elongation factor Ts n=1 Tax=Natranaerobius thermophilus (strain ATCC BAA-1301 / DSM 18059 / JW/NM-WN-LF) TaxID=457570 RepID=B2A381_NATTJ|nr:translation elongation factor Ts [Natranaerobius thermophilus]ACB85011.1 translation elongation factor Ts (EF-Ts) [Natranaerobius thermophilus JW/NM-WN-LF]